MTTIQRFEDLEVWQLARELCKEIYQLTSTGIYLKDFDTRNQMRRSASSIMDNIPEGFDRCGKGEFIQFLSISKGSSAELKSQLYKSLDIEYIKKDQFEYLYNKTDRVSKMINGLIEYLKSSDIKGRKYPESKR